LDIKTTGYVIAPWGRHHSGRYYTPDPGFDLSQAPIADPHVLVPAKVPTLSGYGALGGEAKPAAIPTKAARELDLREESHWYYYGQRNGMMYDPAYRYRIARSWLMEQDPCVQGERGSKRLFRYACELVRWYLLDEAQVLGLLIEFNKYNLPVFSIQEIVDAVESAFELGTWSERGRFSYEMAHAREKAKSIKASRRRSEKRADIRNGMWYDLHMFLAEHCKKGEDRQVSVNALWASFVVYAPWVSEHRGVFGSLVHEAMTASFPTGVERERNRGGHFFVGVGLYGEGAWKGLEAA
jgi:hypothetical protein